MEDGSYIYLLLYVDDMLIASQNLLAIKKLKSILSSEIEMKDKRVVEKILGMEIKRDRVQKKLFLFQKEYIKKVLNCFEMESAKSIYTPLTTSICPSELNTTQSESEKEYMSRVPYASVVESLMYTMVCTRLDLAQEVSVVNRYMSNPRKEH